MSTFNQRIKPATEAHVNAQFSFLEDMSKTLFQSFQKISELNLQLTQSFIAESTQFGRDIVSAEKPTEMLSATTAQTQPTAEKLREYKDSLARISAEAQAELTRCAERHVPETSRTAKALAEEFVRISAEETQKAMQGSQDAMRRGAAAMDPNRDATHDGGAAGRQEQAQSAAGSEPNVEDLENRAEKEVPAALSNGAESAGRDAASKKTGTPGRNS
ncbi:MAG TPA: TIGR01841 family phasin [Janthinobacterium sp.]|jgi:phasin family protein|nr:TIGR01841 family phasin [Janthinobacterium sp.]